MVKLGKLTKVYYMSIQRYRQQVEECSQFLKARLEFQPEWGIISGTGQGRLAGRLEDAGGCPYHDLPHFPRATSPSHEGHLRWGRLAGKPVLMFQGRFHAYEGYSMREVSLPVRVMATSGVKALIISNAAGALNTHFRAGVDAAESVARTHGLILRKGVYVAVKGPSLETPAETRFLRTIGADAVGMSTVPEVIAAVHAGLRILGISVI
jgi:purine-nucleoside phosphorylase